VGHRMDDDEARYLIDQFNKFASWRVRYFEILFPYLAVGVAIAALYFSSIGGESSSINRSIIAFGFVAFLIITTVLALDRHTRYREELVLLEGHRFKYKSLPDSVMFNRIVERKFKPKDLKELLKREEERLLKRGY